MTQCARCDETLRGTQEVAEVALTEHDRCSPNEDRPCSHGPPLPPRHNDSVLIHQVCMAPGEEIA